MFKNFLLDKSNIIDFRLDPSLYFYSLILKNKMIKKGIKYNKLITISENISDGEHSHISRQKEKGIRYLYGRNIKEGIINFDPISDIPFISNENYNLFKRTHIKENDVLLTIVGTIGKSAIYHEKYINKAGIPRHIAKITISEKSKITPEFLTAFFRSKIGKWQLLNISTGNIQPLLSIKNIKSLDIPQVEEDFINKITILEQKQINCEIDALNLLKQAQKIFYDKINIDFEAITKEKYYSINFSELKKSDLWTPEFYNPLYINTEKAIRKQYQTISLDKIVTFKKGDEVGSSNYNEYLNKKNTDIPFIRTSDIVNYEVDLYPDYYIPEEIYLELKQDLKCGDIIFTKDGKIGVVGMITSSDQVIISSGIFRLRLKNIAKKYNLTSEYLFVLLSLKEIGLYSCIRRTVIASTIPHLKEDNIKNFIIPILDKSSIDKITELVKEAFELKAKRKQILKEVREKIENYFDI